MMNMCTHPCPLKFSVLTQALPSVIILQCINYARAIQAEVRWIQGTIKHTFSDTETKLFAFGLTVFIYSRQSLYET